MAINLALKPRIETDPESEDWGRAWFGWDPTMSEQQLWDQNRGTWHVSRSRLDGERLATLSFQGTIRVVVEITGHRMVGDLVAIEGSVLPPGDAVRDALIGHAVSVQRNPVSYFETQELDSMSSADRHPS